MSKKGGSSAASDPMAGYAALMQSQAATKEAQLGNDWLDFSKQQYADSQPRQAALDDLTAKVGQSQLTSMDNSNQWAAEDRARYKSVFQPLQDKFIDKANNWDSADNQAKAAAEAKADVTNSIAAQKGQMERDMASKGIDPTSGAYAGIERAAGVEGALAEAGAQNNARNNLRQQAVQLQGQAINMGNGLPAQASAGLSQASGLGAAAETGVTSAAQNQRSNIGIMNTGYQGASSANTASGSLWGNVYSNRVNLLNQQDAQANASTNSLLGGVGSIVGMFAPSIFKSDENAKEDKREVRGVLDALKEMPVEAWKYKPGEGPGGEQDQHIGTYAQAFQKATGLGDGKSINVIDALGVTMGAVKELAEKVEAGQGKGDGDERPARGKPKAKSIMRMAA